jgi:hypothetical protein
LTEVDPLGVPERDVLYDAGKGNIANLHDEVDMVRHETETMYAAAELFYSVLKNQV